MIQKIRELMRPHMHLQKRYPYWMSDLKELTLKDRLVMVCLMIYSMQPDAQVKNYIINIFSHGGNRVKKEKLALLKPVINSWLLIKYYQTDAATQIALTNDFLLSAGELTKPTTRETDVEAIALKLYDEFFD